MAYYHVLIETIEKIKNGKHEEPIMAYVYDIPESEKDVKIVRDIALQYMTGQEFFVGGRPLVKQRVARIEIVKTDSTSSELVKQAYSKLPRNVVGILHKERVVFNDSATSVFADIISDARTMALNNGLEITPNRVFEQKPNNPTVYHTTVNATNAMVQAGTVGSQQTMNTNDKTDREYFAKLREKVKEIKDNEQILSITQEMEQAVVQKDGKTFGEKYTKFMASVADHMTIILPFVPWLTRLLKQL